MRKRTLTALRLAGGMALAGLVLCGAAFAAAGFDYRKLSTADRSKFVTRQETFSPSQVDKIAVAIDVDDFTVKTSADGQIHLTYMDRDKLKYYISLQDGVLQIQQENRSGKFQIQWLSFDFETWSRDDRAVLELPEAFAGDLQIQNDVGEVVLSDTAFSGAVDVSVNTGAVKVQSLSVKTMTVTSKVGDVTCQDCAAEQYLYLHSSTGTVLLENCTVEKDLLADCKTGKVKAVRTRAQTMNFSTKTGDVTLQETTAERYQLSTKTGDIGGSICGQQEEYTILTDAVVGTAEPKSQKGTTEKELQASTNTGDIRLQFVPEGG